MGTPERKQGQSANLSKALAAWGKIIGDGHVFSETDPIFYRYLQTSTGVEKRVAAVLRPKNEEEVVAIVKVAEQFGCPLYPISTGRNWGYGSALPPQDGCAILDLSRMKRITDFDPRLGTVTVEPGVTQGQLSEYLQHNHQPFMVPVHGGGPDCSLIGNAMERGYGITPEEDHFSAMTELRAVLPSGEIYQGVLSEMGLKEIDRLFRWDIGPYLPGLFSQSNFGVVTRATITLARRAERPTILLFQVAGNEELAQIVDALPVLKSELGSTLGSLNLMNALRVLSMTVPYPKTEERTLSPLKIAAMAKQSGITAWTGAGALYGPPAVIAKVKSHIRSRLRGRVSRLLFADDRQVSWIRRFLPFFSKTQSLLKRVDAMDSLLKLTSGVPLRSALPLAYWKQHTQPNPKDRLSPANDGCGLVWYSPLVPMKSERVLPYTAMVEKVMHYHGFEPLITLTTLSSRCFDSTVPILFDRYFEEERSQICYQHLLEAGRKLGVFPYRFGVEHMNAFKSSTLAQDIKTAIDPKGILSPGRYVK